MSHNYIVAILNDLFFPNYRYSLISSYPISWFKMSLYIYIFLIYFSHARYRFLFSTEISSMPFRSTMCAIKSAKTKKTAATFPRTTRTKLYSVDSPRRRVRRDKRLINKVYTYAKVGLPQETRERPNFRGVAAAFSKNAFRILEGECVSHWYAN